MTASDKQRLGDFFRNRRERGLPGLPVMSVTLDAGLVGRDTLDRKTDTNLGAEEHLLIKEGDIAYNMMRMWQGASGLAKHDGIISPAYVVLAPKNGIDPVFASYWFKSSRMIYLFWAYSYGLTSDRLRLYFKDFAQIPAEVPPQNEQIRIGKILSLWDKAIAQTEKLIEAKRKLKKGLMQQLLTGRQRFPGFNNSWKESRLQDICKIIYGKSQKNIASEDGPYPIWGTGGIVGYTREYLYDKPSVILGRKGTIDRPSMCSKPFWAIDTTFYTEIKRNIYPKWLYQRFLFIPWHIFNEASGVPSLSRETVYKIRIDVPDIDEQRKIAGVLDTVDCQIETLVRLSNSFEQQKRGLMQRLLTGQVRVNAVEEMTT